MIATLNFSKKRWLMFLKSHANIKALHLRPVLKCSVERIYRMKVICAIK